MMAAGKERNLYLGPTADEYFADDFFTDAMPSPHGQLKFPGVTIKPTVSIRSTNTDEPQSAMRRILQKKSSASAD